jgi:DNA polymerase family A
MINAFREVVVVDFEFTATAGNRPLPVCLVAHELRSGRRFRTWQGQFGRTPPYATGPDVLLVAYFASAELGCYRALGWPMPQLVLDLFAEFRNHTNGLSKPAGTGLLGACVYFGLDAMDAADKKEMQLAIGAGTWHGRYSPEEILAYCERDVATLECLLPRMLPHIDLPRALLRGRYMAAVAAMEYAGTPIDVDMLARLREGWLGLQDQLIAAIDVDFGVFEGRTFKSELFEAWLIRNDIPWPRLDSGRLGLSDGVFRQQARAYPIVAPLRELRSALADLRLNDLAVGDDGRNRCLLSPFGARTGRNTPSNTRFIFGPSVWLRGLVKPPAEYGLAYIDWEQQEIGIAAALSRDPALTAAYQSGDTYLTFAKQARAVPDNATEKTHPTQRELFKQCCLAVQYGQGEDGLAQRIGQPRSVARELLRFHHETYKVFWRWSDAAVDAAMLNGSLHTVFGWRVRPGADPNPRSLRNFPMQGNGTEMMRLAACLATERGLEVCAPVHDAFLICAPLERLEADIAAMRAAMAEASRVVLNGFELRTDCKTVCWPDRYMDKRGRVMWERVMGLLDRQEGLRRAV